MSAAESLARDGRPRRSLRRPVVPDWLTADLGFLLLFGLLIVSAGWSYVGRWRSVPLELQYIPRDNSILVVSGPIASVWRAFDDHFGPVIHPVSDRSPTSEKKGLAKLFDDLQGTLRDQKLPVTQLSDLAKYGVDTTRGVFVSVYRADQQQQGPSVAVVPILDQATFYQTLKILSSDEKDNLPTPVPGASGMLSFKVGDLYLVFPERGIALLSDNQELLGRSLSDRPANREYAASNDDLYDSVRKCLNGPLASGPTLFVFARPDGVPGVRHVGIGLELTGGDVLLNAQIGVTSDSVKLVSDLLADPPDAAWPTHMPHEVAGALAVQDKALARILDVLGSTSLRHFLETEYGGFLWTLRDMPSLSRVVIAVTGYHDGLPDLLTGVWADQEPLESRLQALRIKFRRDRDVEILTAAGSSPPGSSGNAVSSEEFSTFGRYTRRPNGTFDGAPVREDLENGAYAVQVTGGTIRYIAPRITANDRRFRKAFEKLTDADFDHPETLDRYRMAYVSHDGATWIATDVADLKALLTRTTDAMDSSPYVTSSTRNWRTRDKMQLFLNVDQISKFGLLSPESAVEDFVKDYLLDFRDHPAVAGNVRACSLRRDCLSVSVRLLPRLAIK